MGCVGAAIGRWRPQLVGIRRLIIQGLPEHEAGPFPNLKAVEWTFAFCHEHMRARDGLIVRKSLRQHCDARETPCSEKIAPHDR